jgi:spore coat protein CotH
MGFRLSVFHVVASLVLVTARLHAVVINEIHYNPVEGANTEFVELFNPSGEDVDLGSWGFSRGIDFEFAPGEFLPARGFVVVCRNRIGVSRRFGIPVDALRGDYIGNLGNGGETLTLVDANGRIIDEVDYDDRAPWDGAADGLGSSLERICESFDSGHPANWQAAKDDQPTPLASNNVLLCPPEIPASPRVAINEILYHPPGDADAELEFVELVNLTGEPVNLRGWFFVDGIDFIFEDDTTIPPGGQVAVCRNQEAVRGRFGTENVVGDFTGQLSNDGERVTLFDGNGEFVDSVRYGESGDWPIVADGGGVSLEKMQPAAPSDDPGSWNESLVGRPDVWNTQEATGRATSDRLLIYNASEGEFLIDNVSLVRVDEPDVELITNGGFDEGIDGWLPRGSHETSAWDPDGSVDGGGALRLISTGRGTGRTQGISFEIEPGLDRSPDLTYRLRIDWRHVSGEIELTMRLSGASVRTGVYWRYGSGVIASPGEPNGNVRESLPPFVERISRVPRQPTSEDPVEITARVRGVDVGGVTLLVDVIDIESFELEMMDDGLSGDGAAGDGVWGVEVPPQPHGARVTFRALSRSSQSSTRSFPPASDPMPVHGYYVNDSQPDTNLPLYTVIYRPERPQSARSLIAALNCSTYQPCSFAFEGDLWTGCGVRRRGQSVCGDADVIKKFLKVRFPPGHDFKGVRKINLQSLWTDKSLIREHMSWENFDSIGNPYCTHAYFRLHINGEYFGLYADLEHPGKRFLARNGLNEDGNLYKATASREERNGVYEKKTNEDGDFTDLRSFLNDLHGTNGAALVGFFGERTDEDAMIDYQVAQVLPNNRDYPHKNHYLYHDTDTGKWMPITWDMDLTYGKRWDGSFEGVLNDRMDNPGITPWYTTRVAGGGTGNHLLDRFFTNAGTHYRRAYIARLWAALQEKYTNDIYGARILELRDELLAEQAIDIEEWGRSRASANDPRAPREFDPNLDRVRSHIQQRRIYLLNFLRSSHQFTGLPRLKITELMYDPAEEDEEGEFLELWNSSGEVIDISGWRIEGIGARTDDGTRDVFVFPAATSVAENEVIVVAKDPVGFRIEHGDAVRVFGPYSGQLSNGGEGLRVKDVGPGHPATVDWLRYSSKHPWPRRAGGLGFSLELTDVEPNRDNDLPANWRSSLELGGSPGRIEGVTFEPTLFSRGDCAVDGRLNVSDAVALLLFLFRGGEVRCEDACDVDGSQQVNLSDAVFLLNFIFGRGVDILPAPGPGVCGPASPACAESTCGGGE